VRIATLALALIAVVAQLDGQDDYAMYFAFVTIAWMFLFPEGNKR
jgi:hypothetical protein